MRGFKFDFNTSDLIIGTDGQFPVASIDNQNVALIAVSQVCVVTKPEIGAQIGARLMNRPINLVGSVLADAKRQAESDGAKNVVIKFTKNGQLIFTGAYEN